jgi:hypothetical protein
MPESNTTAKGVGIIKCGSTCRVRWDSHIQFDLTNLTMSQSITLFSGYSQRENRTTNYCLLILKMLYEENPKFLAQVLGTLVSEEAGERIGVKFRQQERKAASTPDGLILQSAVTVYLETKNFDWFYDDQLANHLAALNAESPGFKVLLVLSSFEAEEEDSFMRIRALCIDRYKGSIAFERVSFEDLVQALHLEHLPKNLADAIVEFRTYLDEENLLPSWRRRLDVVNCAGIPDDVISGGAYLCPATAGPYNHARCKFFGMYRNKRVEKVALIDAVVDLEDDEKATVKWRNVSGDNDDFVSRARAKLAQRRAGQYPTRVFLLGPLYDTDFRKDSPGGMQASKQYFDVGSLDAADASDLASKLQGKTWSQLRGQTAV